MKKIYTLIAVTFFLFAANSFAQNTRKASASGIHPNLCKSCVPQLNTVHDTMCNHNPTDTITLYYADMTPHDSGWAIGMNAYGDMGWAERYVVTGSASVTGGAYLLFEKSHAATSGGTATGHVYSIAPTTGKPNTSLGSANIPFSSMVLTGQAPTFFTFASPVAVVDSFFMSFEFAAYTLSGPDTIGVMQTITGERTTTNVNQNCAKFSDGNWYYELTENWKMKTNYQLCAIADVATGVNNSISKNDLTLYAAYPNPSANDVTINYSLANAGKTSIEIFDAQGKSIMKIDKGTLPAGKNFETINLSSFSVGTYFYNVKTDNGTLFSRFTVVK